LVKIHRNYTVEEVARLFGCHKNSVRRWIKSGLPVLDDRRPMLIHGSDLRAFLESQRKKSRQRCKPGQLYCVGCRAPKAPAGTMVDYIPASSSSGNLRGICPDCDSLIHRRVSLAKLEACTAGLEVTFPHPESRIRERAGLSSNSDFSRRGNTDDFSQCGK
jgi:excisionase family DNA binding protein